LSRVFLLSARALFIFNVGESSSFSSSSRRENFSKNTETLKIFSCKKSIENFHQKRAFGEKKYLSRYPTNPPKENARPARCENDPTPSAQQQQQRIR